MTGTLLWIPAIWFLIILYALIVNGIKNNDDDYKR